MFRICFIIILFLCQGDSKNVNQSNEQLLLLDSFIPASMQIIAHLTELMKYDLKPESESTTTTTTARPTSTHKPGIYQPNEPANQHLEYLQRLKAPSSGYFERYLSSNVNDEALALIFGKKTNDIFKLINGIDEIREIVDVDQQVEDFSQIYDDSIVLRQILRQKRKPPTRAYVALLSLYDLLNKESKKLGLNKYNGYSNDVLKQLIEFSMGTSSEQLKAVLNQIAERKDTRNVQILRKISEILMELNDSSSYLKMALKNLPPLRFSL